MTTENKRIEVWVEGVTAGTPVESQVRFDVNVPLTDSQIKILYSGVTHTFPSTEKTQVAIEDRAPFDAVVTTQAEFKIALETYAIQTIFINKGRDGLFLNGFTASIPDASQKAIYGSPIIISTTSTITCDPISMTNVYFYNDLLVNTSATLNLADSGSPGVASYFVTNLNRPNPHYLAASIGGTIDTSVYTVFNYEYVVPAEIPTFTGTGTVAQSYWANTNVNSTDTDAIHDNVAGEINAITAKSSIVQGDLLLIEDFADSYNKKKITMSLLLSGSRVETIPLGMAYTDITTGNDIPHYVAMYLSNIGYFQSFALDIRNHSVNGQVRFAVYNYLFVKQEEGVFTITGNGVTKQALNSPLKINAGLYYLAVIKNAGTFDFAGVLGDGTKHDVAFQGAGSSTFPATEATFNNSGRSIWMNLNNAV